MEGVYWGNQHRLMCTEFTNVAQFKKWHNKEFLEIATFRFLQ